MTPVVVLPGMGATAYVQPLARALDDRGLPATVLDLPGFGSPRPLACRPAVRAVAEAAGDHVRRLGEPVVLLGHSTGAVSALLAALALQDDGLVRALVLAGPVSTPRQRSVPRIAAVVPAAFRRDTMGELRVVPQYLRGRDDAVRLLRSALQEAPETLVGDVRVPLLVTAGRADSLAPAWWLSRLAASATAAPAVRVVRLPGSHNNPWTQGGRLAAVVEGFVAQT